MRIVALVTICLAIVASAAVAPAAAPPPTPPCPEVEGWTATAPFGPIDNGNAVQFECNYSLPGRAQQLVLDLHWYKPTARDVDVDYNQCGRATSGGAYYTDIWSKSSFVHEEYVVNSGTAPDNAAVFRAEQERIQKAALTLLAATEKLAKSCTTSTPSAETHRDTTRPTVRVRPASGHAGATIALRFTVADDSGRVGILLRIYRSRANRTVLLSKSYGTAGAVAPGRSHTARVRAPGRGTHLWCVTATDAAGNRATACGTLVAR